jgi:predicted permease
MAAYLTDFSIDERVTLFALAVSIATGLVFGIVPALKAARAGDLTAALKQREQRTAAGGSRRWLGTLVAAEIAVAVVLLVNGSLIVQSFARLQQTDLGFNPDGLVTLEFTASPQRYPAPADRIAYVNRLLERVGSVPGVASAGITTNIPLQVGSTDSIFTVERRPPAKVSDVPITAHRMVTPDYLKTLGVRLVKGRLLDARDRENAQLVAVITEEFARQAWPDEDPIGRRIRRGRVQDTAFPWLTVVGVVADTKEDAFNFRVDRPAWYLPYAQQSTTAPLNLVVRAAGDPRMLERDLRDAVRAVDDRQAVSAGKTMTEHVAQMLITERFSAVLMTTLASIGLFLAACGLYGVIAYSASQRTGEIGLRMALGADRRDILTLVMRQGAAMVAIGLLAGIAIARALSLVLAGTLYGVSPNDPRTFATVVIVLATVSVAACYLPALRATRVDPIVALKAE